MFLLFPYGTDNPLRRRPLANYALIIANVLIFLGSAFVFPDDQRMFHLLLDPVMPKLYQFITYAFLHGGFWHVFGNMLFLYIFGNNVNDRLGHAGYVFLYLAGGIFSGLGHAFLSDTPVLGASGAVAAITGAYLVLFPKTIIYTFYWIIYFIGSAQFSALYFILFKLIIYDNIVEPKFGGPSNVAYSAHLAGYAFGVGIPLVLIALRLLPHSQYDLWALVKRWRRRQVLRRMANQGYDPYTPAPLRKTKVELKVQQSTPLDPHAEQIMNFRGAISQAISAADMALATENYLNLISLDPHQVLPEQQQLDIANKLMSMGRHVEAAHAYEAFVTRYPKYPFLEQVQLMLGLLYSRYLEKKELARKHLQAALGKLTDENQRQMCREELSQLS
jgi:membrane associated rhomboid family serine protease